MWTIIVIFLVLPLYSQVWVAEETDVEGKEKNTERQLLQPGRCLEEEVYGGLPYT
mgnify:CR=1 FL=1